MQKSTTKYGDIYVKNCYFEEYKKQNRDKMFPMEESPYLWPACNDAYYFTWKLDPTKKIEQMDPLNVERLARSSGFCPHSRCQLGDLANSDADGFCPAGLCYTKLEVIMMSNDMISL